jgi:hypothetical protein
MRILVVIPHYYGPPDPNGRSPIIASHIEPLARIAALNETIVCLHRNFGPIRHVPDGPGVSAAASRNGTVDIVVVAIRDRHVLPSIGFGPDVCAVEYVEGPPARLSFQVQRILKQRLGGYDFYCLMEDDLAIHDPDFFAKLVWFQSQFGPKALLAPTRVETSYMGTPGKFMIDPQLPERLLKPFRRPGQREELRARWNGLDWAFRIPNNPHAASYFLTQEQMAYWAAQPSFDDGDASWIGTIESGVTLGIGKVFDIYKAVLPDPFFLEIHHFGATYASRMRSDRRSGEPPLLAIAQNALRQAFDSGNAADSPSLRGMENWLAEGTAAEQIGRLHRQTADLRAAVERQRHELSVVGARGRSLRWLIRSTLAELSRRLVGWPRA